MVGVGEMAQRLRSLVALRTLVQFPAHNWLATIHTSCYMGSNWNSYAAHTCMKTKHSYTYSKINKSYKNNSAIYS